MPRGPAEYAVRRISYTVPEGDASCWPAERPNDQSRTRASDPFAEAHRIGLNLHLLDTKWV